MYRSLVTVVNSPVAAHSLIHESSGETALGLDNLRYEYLKQLAGRNSSPAEMDFVRIIAEVLTSFANVRSSSVSCKCRNYS